MFGCDFACKSRVVIGLNCYDMMPQNQGQLEIIAWIAIKEPEYNFFLKN